jgi:hypothetical protein
MSIDIFMNDTCPKCRKPIRLRSITPHPTRYDLAIHNFECADCGVVKTKTLLVKPGMSRSDAAASASEERLNWRRLFVL